MVSFCRTRARRCAGSIRNHVKLSQRHFPRCGQPGQQHGLRMPSMSSERTRSTCCILVSGFFTEMVQQIHSLRASGVMSSHAASARGEARSAFLKSAGNVCTVPPESAFFAMDYFMTCEVKSRLRAASILRSRRSRQIAMHSFANRTGTSASGRRSAPACA